MDLGMTHWSLLDRPLVLFILLNTSLRCSSNDKRLSSIIRRCLYGVAWKSILLLKVNGGLRFLLTFLGRQVCHFNLIQKIIISCHTLSNAFDVSRKTCLTSNPSQNDLYISYEIDKNWMTQESLGLKPNWFCEIRPF